VWFNFWYIYIYIYIVAKSIYFRRSSKVHWTNTNTVWSKTLTIFTVILRYFPGYGQRRWKHFVRSDDKEFHDIKPTKYTNLFLRYYVTISHLHCYSFGPHGTITSESNGCNTALYQISHFCVQLTWRKRVKLFKCRHFFEGCCINVMDRDIQHLGGNLRTWRKSAQHQISAWISRNFVTFIFNGRLPHLITLN
jgi:hypothetical protein